MSKLFTLYTVATGTPLEVEIGIMATLEALHLSGLLASRYSIPRGTPRRFVSDGFRKDQ